MRVAIVGAGNVGANLALHLVKLNSVKSLQLYSANHLSAVGALLDVASAAPIDVRKIELVDRIESEIVVLSAGLQPHARSSSHELLNTNLTISSEVLKKVNVSPRTVVIAVATPVDIITKAVQRTTDLPSNKVIGFGGDLDLNRLRFTLQNFGISEENSTIVGEHGRNTIPVYTNELAYEQITTEVRTFLARIAGKSTTVRNLASGELLARLVESIAEDRRMVHCVTCYHPRYGDWFTWPCVIGKNGVESLESPALGPLATGQLEALIQSRKSRNSNR